MRAATVSFAPVRARVATLGVALALCLASLPAVAGGPVYEAQARSLVSGGQTRHYLLATPTAAPAGPLPLVISLHGDGGSGAGMRAALPLEAAAAGAAVFAYPDAAGGTFEYWNDAGRQREATFVTDLIAALDAELDLDTGRVYLAGFSGGATMANALGCRLGDAVVRKLGIHSGSLYPVQVAPGVNDFGYTGNGGVDCDLPGAMLVWGMNDATPGVDYATGQNIRNNHTATQQCEAATTPTTPAPCVAYAGCAQPVEWCAVGGLGHAVWNQATAAMWRFFAADAAGPVDPPEALWGDGFEGGAAPAPTRWVGGYHVGYERNLYPVADIDFDAITHLMVGRVIPNADGTLARHFDIDNVNGPLWAQSAIDAAQAAGRKAVLMVGGAGEIAGWRAAADDGTRAAFVANLLDAVDDFGADGLDIDWEPLDTQDHTDVLALLQALRTARPGLLLTMPVMWINSNIEWNPRPVGEAAFLAAAAPLLDQVNVMTYEMAAAYEGWHSWFASPLHGEAANTPSSVESSVAYYRGAGVPAAKLGIGIGFYGNCFRGVSQPRVPVVPGNFVVSDGAMSYRNIVSSYAPAMTAHYDAVARAPWLGSAAMAGPSQCNLVTYENAASIAEKGAFVNTEGLGGTIIWTVGQGHLPDAPAGQRDPLLDAVREAFLDAPRPASD